MRQFVACALVVGAAGASASAQINGSYKPSYGPALTSQGAPTQFGDSNTGNVQYANGSELDALFCYGDANGVNLLFTGNLEGGTNSFNKFDLFIEGGSAGQNQLRGDNANVDFNGLNRMAGLTFDAGFSASHWISVTAGGGSFGMFATGARLLPGGGGFGAYLGGSDGQSGGALGGGNNFLSVSIALNNSNILGVTSASAAGALTATTGIEVFIPWASIDLSPGQVFRLTAFVNGQGHDFVSNQVLGSLPSNFGNLGEPSTVNFANYAGNQFVVIPAPGAMALLGMAGLITARRRR